MDKKIEKAKEYAFLLHDVICNQKYHKTLPFSFHLEMVAAQAEKFKFLLQDTMLNGKITPENITHCLIGAFLHDSIEDGRVTYNDIKEIFGEEIAEIVYACTELRGKNRSERHGKEFIEGLKRNELALYVKLCDVIANVLFSILSNTSMYKKYKKEFPKIKEELYNPKFRILFDYLEGLFALN